MKLWWRYVIGVLLLGLMYLRFTGHQMSPNGILDTLILFAAAIGVALKEDK